MVMSLLWWGTRKLVPSTVQKGSPAQSSPSAETRAADESASRAAPSDLKSGPATVDWNSMIPGIRTALKQGLVDGVEARYPIHIVREADITGDGVPEALVYTGDGGASTDFLAAMRIEDGTPVVARFKNANGKIADPGFLQGSSVTHGSSTEMLPEEKAIYLGGYFMNNTGTGLSRCNATAYRWNAKTKIFDWDRTLSKQITKIYCDRERKALFQQ